MKSPAKDYGVSDSKKIFDRASEFHASCFVLQREAFTGNPSGVNVGLLLPVTVLSAFTSEIYLKCLYAIDNGGNNIGGHDLYRLFRLLNLTTRRIIVAEWGNYVFPHKGNPDDIEFMKAARADLVLRLKGGGNAFLQFRYVYQKNGRGDFALSELPDVLRNAVRRLKPEWKEFGQVRISKT